MATIPKVNDEVERVEFSGIIHNNENILLCRCCKTQKNETPVTQITNIDEFLKLEDFSLIICTFCSQIQSVRIDSTLFYTPEQFLENVAKWRKLAQGCYNQQQEKVDGWFKMETKWDRRVLFVLSQIIYKEYEKPEEELMQVEFDFPAPTDLVKLLWLDKQPVGFYTAKLKGTLDRESFSWYTMTTLDTLFVRKCYRGRSLGHSAIKDLLLYYPGQNVGFSFPISLPMKQILRKHLELTPSDRARFWEITGCGTEGNTRNLWLMFNRPKSSKSRRTTTTTTPPILPTTLLKADPPTAAIDKNSSSSSAAGDSARCRNKKIKLL